jgi:hypothetical protein
MLTLERRHTRPQSRGNAPAAAAPDPQLALAVCRRVRLDATLRRAAVLGRVILAHAAPAVDARGDHRYSRPRRAFRFSRCPDQRDELADVPDGYHLYHVCAQHGHPRRAIELLRRFRAVASKV